MAMAWDSRLSGYIYLFVCLIILKPSSGMGGGERGYTTKHMKEA